jgi:hypothetical protein
MTTSPVYSFLSSSLVKEVARFGGDITDFVPPASPTSWPAPGLTAKDLPGQQLDVEAYIGQLEQLLAEARPVPLSSSVMVGRRDVEDVLAELRTRLPDELRQSRWIIKERDELLAAGAREAEQLMTDTRVERDRMLSETEVVRRPARGRADRRGCTRAGPHPAARGRGLRRRQARELRDRAEEDAEAVEKGRERLRGRLASDELAEPEAAELDAEDEGAQQFYDYEQLAEDPDAR